MNLALCCLIECAWYGLDPDADSADCYGVVPARLEVVHGELRLLHRQARAVPVERLQLVVLYLEHIQHYYL